jgi:hypothetical protein
MYWPQPNTEGVKDGEVFPHIVLMRSNAGWYAGEIYYDQQMSGWYPYARRSLYFNDKENAQRHVDYLNKND